MAWYEVDREPRVNVALALRNELQQYGVERMLQSLSIVGDIRVEHTPESAVKAVIGDDYAIVVVALREIDESAAACLDAAAGRGMKTLLLVDEADLSEPRRLAGIRSGGFVVINELSASKLDDTLRRMRDGEVPIPSRLVKSLLELAHEGAEPVRTRLEVRITPREREVILLLVDGLSNKQIARRLGISGHGAKRLVANILAKLDCSNRTLAVARVLREGLYEEYLQQV
ncbi:response regulator transcription factor [Solihabitans fulvus]|uniref:Response regulator transcription factor n=1 Tax=Solihabitans fulvus TaxID=1892852 RepID=A0A5B2X876_9PSEU|nr:LuxR C-terminal-related transcriptional regulator [Solihabitans fulvus]KAA2259393.1 response regulator transcription factor [Solihabitans fulvus]